MAGRVEEWQRKVFEVLREAGVEVVSAGDNVRDLRFVEGFAVVGETDAALENAWVGSNSRLGLVV